MIDKLATPGRSTAKPSGSQPRHPVADGELVRLEREAWRGVIDAAGRQYAAATLDNFQFHGTDEHQGRQRAALTAIRGFCDGFPDAVTEGRGVVLYGPCGTGKDHLMIGMLREAIRLGCHSVKWVDAAEMFGDFKDALGAQQNVGELLRELVRPQLLAISDLVPGSEALTPFEADILFRLLNARGRRLKATWVNANVTDSQEMAAKIPAKCLSRIDFKSLPIPMHWPDYRPIAK